MSALASLGVLAAGCADPTPDQWPQQDPGSVGLAPELVEKTREVALQGGGAGLVVRHGKAVLWWGDPNQRFDLKSTTKSIGSLALGLALADESLALDSKLAQCARDSSRQVGSDPRAADWLSRITLLQLATHTAGFAKTGGFPELLHEPGTRFAYSDGGANWLADCITLASGRDLEAWLFERIFTRLGFTPRDLRWRDNLYRPTPLAGIPRREIGSGVSAHVQALAKIGQLLLQNGVWEGERLLPERFVERFTRAAPETAALAIQAGESQRGARARYGLLWWSNDGGALEGVPRDAFWSWGLYDSTLAVIPSLGLVLARAGGTLDESRDDFGHDAVERMLRPLVLAAAEPHPTSNWTLEWAPAETVRRRAPGSDNWPLAWAEDDALYTAYGDGWGFEPKIEKKLSLGFARVSGGPDDFVGTNIRSESGERVGQGPKGEKASGLISIDGRLFLWARNAGNARLGWSDDRARSWQWADWKLQTSFGAPGFVQFGRDYSGARDAYVYVYSQDSDSAYKAADRMVMARVPSDRLREQAAYEFFAGMDAEGQALWSPHITERAGVFENPGSVYRSGLSYNAGLGRYLWCQVRPGPQLRFEGGLGVYEAPEPWGPWRVVYRSSHWDMGPGESCRFPPKWMSEDGRTVHMVFSGEDHFSVRRAELSLD